MIYAVTICRTTVHNDNENIRFYSIISDFIIMQTPTYYILININQHVLIFTHNFYLLYYLLNTDCKYILLIKKKKNSF